MRIAVDGLAVAQEVAYGDREDESVRHLAEVVFVRDVTSAARAQVGCVARVQGKDGKGVREKAAEAGLFEGLERVDRSQLAIRRLEGAETGSCLATDQYLTAVVSAES